MQQTRARRGQENDMGIKNPTFAHPYHEFGGASEIKVAHDWVPFWIEEGGKQGYPRPEWYPKQLDGAPAQAIQSTHARHIGGVFQVIELPQGVTRFSVMVDYRYQSGGASGGGGIGSKIGVEPAGRTDLVAGSPVDPAQPLIPSIVWGDWWGQDGQNAWPGDTWRTLRADVARSSSRQVTLILLSQCRFPAHNNHSFWAHARLDAGQEPPPAPGPGDEHLATIAGEITKIRVAVDALAGRGAIG
jgi:hypothetical protein